DVFDCLGSRITFLVDNGYPLDPTEEKRILAIEASDASHLARSLQSAFGEDSTMKKVEYRGEVLWVATTPGGQSGAGASPQTMLGPRTNSALCVARGQLFVASHVDFLQKVLDQGTKGGLAQHVDYRLTAKRFERSAEKANSLRFFFR